MLHCYSLFSKQGETMIVYSTNPKQTLCLNLWKYTFGYTYIMLKLTKGFLYVFKPLIIQINLLGIVNVEGYFHIVWQNTHDHNRLKIVWSNSFQSNLLFRRKESMFNNHFSRNESRAWQLSLSESKLHNNLSLIVWVGRSQIK